MSIINSQPLIGASGNQGYFLTKSLRFRSSASAYLNRTPASAGNRKIWTWSGWVKRGSLGVTQWLFDADNGSTDSTEFNFAIGSGDTISIGGSVTTWRVTTQVFRDPSAWYHIVLAIDTTQSTANNRIRLYVNGSEITAFSTLNNPTQNLDLAVNQTIAHYIAIRTGLTSPLDGYLTEINFIDGQALTPSSFGETSTSTGVWIPKKYTGTYGTNGFYLPFTNTSSTSTLGNDFSGNSNTWTVNNISLTSGATYDSMNDVPTLTSPTAANYCTWNPVGIYVTTPLDGNLKISGTSAGANGTIGASSGKFYWECVYTAIGSSEGVIVGIRSTDSIATSVAENVGYYGGGTENGKKIVNGVGSAYAATWTTNDVIGVALDLDGGTVTFYKNNVSQGAISFTVGGKTWTSFNWRTGPAGTNTGTINFGQQPFTYTPPTGFKALNTFNLPTPTIGATGSSQANKYFNTVLWSGDGASTRAITGVGHAPDFVWIKKRTAGGTVNRDHVLYDIIRGTGANLRSNQTNAESTGNTDELKSFDSDGFSLGNGDNVNGSSGTPPYVGWAWKANGSGSSNTDGSVTSTVSVNTTSGFSIATVAAQNNTSTLTIGHGLGVAPKMIIGKSRSGVGGWSVWHTTLATNELVYLNSTAAKSVDGGTPPAAFTATSSTTFTVQNWNRMIGSGVTGVFYTFSEVAGYSRFGSYTGNGSADGTFVFTGFRPKFVIVKCSSTGTTNWVQHDTAREPYNLATVSLYPNLSNAETTSASQSMDILSNGFKLRNTSGDVNTSGDTYIYMAFAENPFKFSNAR